MLVTEVGESKRNNTHFKEVGMEDHIMILYTDIQLYR